MTEESMKLYCTICGQYVTDAKDEQQHFVMSRLLVCNRCAFILHVKNDLPNQLKALTDEINHFVCEIEIRRNAILNWLDDAPMLTIKDGKDATKNL
jgi:ribosome-binding protein aMBF1 (putative translation factor)